MSDIEPLGNGVFRLITDGLSRRAYAAGSAERRWVFLDGRTYVVDTAPAAGGARRRSRDEHGALSAPMPATVVTITVSPGQRVSQGEVMVMLEAMKMELPVKAPRDGVVKAVHCRAGELVQPGVPLLELE